MKIGIDVDGVLVDMVSYQLENSKEYFKKKFNLEIKNEKGYDIEDIYECTHEQREQFWTKYIWGYCLKAPMTEGAAAVVKKLREEGHQIYVITGRAHTTEKGVTGALFRWMLKHWLKKNRFVYDEIFFVAENNSAADKYDVCMKEKVDVLIDDKPENLYALKDKIKVFCYPAIWNEEIAELDEYRVNSFEEFYEKIWEKL